MHKSLLILFCFFSIMLQAQDYIPVDHKIVLRSAQFQKGNDPRWADPSFDDKSWTTIQSNVNWEEQGFADYDGYAWYRFNFRLPSSLRSSSYWHDSLRIFLSKIDDADEVFLNGRLISKHGRFPEDSGGYRTAWNRVRELIIAANNPLLRWDEYNLIAVKVYDGGGPGGIFSDQPFISMVDIIDKIEHEVSFTKGNDSVRLFVRNNNNIPVSALMRSASYRYRPDSVVSLLEKHFTLGAHRDTVFYMRTIRDVRVEVMSYVLEKTTQHEVSRRKVNNYILTPAPSALPRINSAAVYGQRPRSPFLYKIAASGEKPMKYAAINLPEGLELDKSTGVISGSLKKEGDYRITLIARNAKGEAKKELLVRCGSLLALTPPMGWNSWNCWGLSVSEEKVRSSAQALIDKGLADHGWTYMNIDDGWEDSVRNKNGEIKANSKFPDMKGLGNWLHKHGLKFGIYSSPGPLTCGGYLGSYQHELSDANTYAKWGIDYLKYDWCSYGRIHGGKDSSLASYMKPYQVMQSALRSQRRDIIYSLCQYGMKKVWEWGDQVDGNCWRTTGDIEDTWESLKTIGFQQNEMSPYAKPGRWNDPDMLIVGEVGWGPSLHPTRLNADEQYTHISLWCLLSSPLLIGCDISRLDDFTLNLLTNDELLDINQDPLGKQAKQIIASDTVQVWARPMSDGSLAIGLFNLSDSYKEISIPSKELKLYNPYYLRDCWRQTDLGLFREYKTWVPPHGAAVFRTR